MHFWTLAVDAAPTDLYGWLQSGGMVGLLAFIIIANLRGWWYSGSAYKELQERYKTLEDQNVKWMEIAFKATTISEQVSGVMRGK